MAGWIDRSRWVLATCLSLSLALLSRRGSSIITVVRHDRTRPE